MTPQQANELLRGIGSEMSNVLYNLGQHKQRVITERESTLFYALAKKWDAALSEHARAPAPTSEPGARECGAAVGWDDAITEAVAICLNADKSEHPADLADEIRALATPASPAVLAPCTYPGCDCDQDHACGPVAVLAAPLAPSEIDDMAFGYCPSGKIGELREFAAALLGRDPTPLAPMQKGHPIFDVLMLGLGTIVCLDEKEGRKYAAQVHAALAAADPAPLVAQASPDLPAVLFDGMAVFNEIKAGSTDKVGVKDVAAVLDAVVRLLKVEASPLVEEAQRIVAGKVER